MFGMDHGPITVKNIDGEEFLICSFHGCGHPRDRWPIEFGRFGNISAYDFLYGFWRDDLEQLHDFVFSLDKPGQYMEFGQSPTAPLHLARVEEALRREEILVYALGDPEEAALKALREKIRLTLSQILAQERAEAARLQAVHKHRTTLEKAGALVAAGAGAWGEAGLSFLTWARDVHEVLSLHQRQYRMVMAAWEAYNTASDDDCVETFQRKLAAAEHKELVEALGFDPWKIDRAMLASAYKTVNLVWEDEETRDMLVAFAKDYARAQHSLEWAKIVGGGAFEIVLTAVLVSVTGGIGVAAMLAGKARLLVLLKRLGELFEELAKLRGKVKLRRDREEGVASRESRLEDYVTDEKVPRPQPPPKGNADNDRDDREDREGHGDDEEKSTGTTGDEGVPNKNSSLDKVEGSLVRNGKRNGIFLWSSFCENNSKKIPEDGFEVFEFDRKAVGQIGNTHQLGGQIGGQIDGSPISTAARDKPLKKFLWTNILGAASGKSNSIAGGGRTIQRRFPGYQR